MSARKSTQTGAASSAMRDSLFIASMTTMTAKNTSPAHDMNRPAGILKLDSAWRSGYLRR